MLNKVIKVVNSEDVENCPFFTLVIEKLCAILDGHLTVYRKTSKEERKQICILVKALLFVLYIIYYNVEKPKKIILFFKLNTFRIINALKTAINIFKEDIENKDMAHFVINLCFDDLKQKIYSYNDDQLAEVYQRYVYAEMLGLFPSYNEPFDPKNEEYTNFMKNILALKLDDYMNIKKENSDIFCRNVIPLLLSTTNFDFISYYKNIVNKHIEIVRKEYDDELTSLFRKDDITNDLIKNLIYIFGNDSFVKSFYFILPNEYLSHKEIEFDLELFEKFFRSFIIDLMESLPFIVKVLLKIINKCIQKINSGKEDYNVIYTVLIFNFFISPTILDIYSISIVKYKSLRQLTRILRNLCFGKEFDSHDKLSYFNKIIKKLNSFINEQIKQHIFDVIDIEKNKDKINNEINCILVNKKNANLKKGDKTIILPTFCYQYYWANISNVIKPVKKPVKKNK